MSHLPSVVPTNQVWPTRAASMTRAIRLFDTPIHALEIGTWFGEGSTQIWLHNLPAGSTLTLVDPWRPYGSAADMADPGFNYAAVDSRSWRPTSRPSSRYASSRTPIRAG